ncbi:glucose N-acetyltransferase NDAI_0K00720 [Naumovozyma dairenensis CBS 421]|uniref:Glycosyltransferase family 8 protein n=1 Tax=Naumovozyma dairenensis (strain ATCC 10597 / BCRC 20456 / CBS 421 / NBRC 0211 / NRRL Y-12639) TaxID=1071378 RepID=G0WHK2_NAUDC|nr:hypothetical protein NDAI_0K00720 [Naumovozyma dairenensis CBS 421]CCD27263.1 hypothetical protein NDAI_0K00720 [Naumovozyma dairenensis CBS 421]
MRIISKRRIRFLIFAALGILAIIFFVRTVILFQLKGEIIYYKHFFKQKKDGLQDVYNPLDIKQLPEEVIDELYIQRQEKEQKSGNAIDWSQYAYVNYVTDAGYLCNTLILFDQLKKQFGTKAKLLLLISSELLNPDLSTSVEESTKLLEKIKNIDPEQVVIKHIDNIVKPEDYSPWNESLTKLLVFNQTEYDRIIYLDNDAVLRNNLDELFFIPEYIQFAAPVTYWFLSEHDMEKAYHSLKHDEKLSLNLNKYTKKILPRVRKGQMIYNHLPVLPPSLYLNSENVAKEIISSTSSSSPLFNFHTGKKSGIVKFASNLMVIKPSATTFQMIMDIHIPKIVNKKLKYDMDLINEELYSLKAIISKQFTLFRKSRKHFTPEVLILPFGRYGLLTGSLRNPHHYSMITNDVLGYKRLDDEGNELPRNLQEFVTHSKYIHFSDYPIGKPWYYPSISEFKCVVDEKNAQDLEMETKACDVWNSIYELYFDTRNICHI